MRHPDGILWRARLPLLGIVLVFVTGFIGYLVLGFSVVDAFTNTILVMTTVGFVAGDALETADKYFTDAIAIMGVSTYLALLAVVASAVADGQLGVVTRRRRLERRVSRLRDHVIVCAYGRVGRAVARELAAADVPFVVIDRLESLEPRMRRDGVLYLLGDPTSEEELRRAGIERARALVSAVDSDADSIFIALTARSLSEGLSIVARGSEDAAADRLYRAGADRVVSPYVWSGRHMALLALRPQVSDYLEIGVAGGPSVRVEEILVEHDSSLVGTTVSDARGTSRPLIVRRATGELVPEPPGDQILTAGDVLVLLGGADGASGTAS